MRPTTGVPGAMRSGLLVWLIAVVAACSAPPPTASPLVPSAMPTTSPLPVAEPSATVEPSPTAMAWLPPWSGSSTPGAVVNRTVLPFCGVSQVGLAGPGDSSVRACFAAALVAGRPAEMAEILRTTEGDPIAVIIRSRPGGGVEILFDSTQDQFGSRTWTRQVCTGHVADTESRFFGTDCREEPVGA